MGREVLIKQGNKHRRQMTYQRRYIRKNKYNAKKQRYNGRTYDSKLEASYAMELDWRKRAGEIKEIIPQYKIDLRVNGKHICNYYMDFKLIMADDSVEFHEVKGFEADLWKMKWRITEATLHEIEPNAKLVLVK